MPAHRIFKLRVFDGTVHEELGLEFGELAQRFESALGPEAAERIVKIGVLIEDKAVFFF